MTRIAALTLLVVLVAGCGEKTLKSSEVEGDIRPEYERQTKLKLQSLTCDDDIEAETGATFSCRGLNSSDVKLRIRGSVREVKGSKARYRWDVVQALAPGRIFAAEGKRRLEQQVQKARSMTCPPEVEVKEGTTVRCELETMDDKTFGVTLTLTDDKGGFEVQVDDR